MVRAYVKRTSQMAYFKTLAMSPYNLVIQALKFSDVVAKIQRVLAASFGVPTTKRYRNSLPALSKNTKIILKIINFKKLNPIYIKLYIIYIIYN